MNHMDGPRTYHVTLRPGFLALGVNGILVRGLDMTETRKRKNGFMLQFMVMTEHDDRQTSRGQGLDTNWTFEASMPCKVKRRKQNERFQSLKNIKTTTTIKDGRVGQSTPSHLEAFNNSKKTFVREVRVSTRRAPE
jgi:hypothetical protein